MFLKNNSILIPTIIKLPNVSESVSSYQLFVQPGKCTSWRVTESSNVHFQIESMDFQDLKNGADSNHKNSHLQLTPGSRFFDLMPSTQSSPELSSQLQELILYLQLLVEYNLIHLAWSITTHTFMLWNAWSWYRTCWQQGTAASSWCKKAHQRDTFVGPRRCQIRSNARPFSVQFFTTMVNNNISHCYQIWWNKRFSSLVNKNIASPKDLFLKHLQYLLSVTFSLLYNKSFSSL